MAATRLERLPRHDLPGALSVFEARTARARLLGLAHVARLPPDQALLLPSCRSVHTFGMRFAIDLVFMDRRGDLVRIVRYARPRRAFSARGGHAVLETVAGQAEPFIAAGAGSLVAERRTSAPNYRLAKEARRSS